MEFASFRTLRKGKLDGRHGAVGTWVAIGYTPNFCGFVSRTNTVPATRQARAREMLGRPGLGLNRFQLSDACMYARPELCDACRELVSNEGWQPSLPHWAPRGVAPQR